MKDRENEIKYLIYLKSQLIKQTKKEIKNLHNELDGIGKNKKLISLIIILMIYYLRVRML